MDELSKNELREIIFNTLHFCGGVFSASKDYCRDNGIEFSGEVQAFILKCLEENHRMDEEIRNKLNSSC